jgi:hypothetical protein
MRIKSNNSRNKGKYISNIVLLVLNWGQVTDQVLCLVVTFVFEILGINFELKCFFYCLGSVKTYYLGSVVVIVNRITRFLVLE